MPTVEVLKKHAAKEIGEGPHYEQKYNRLLYVDIQSGDAHRLDLTTGEDGAVHLDGDVSIIVPSDKGDYIVTNELKLLRLNFETKETQEIAEVPPIGTRDRFNDGKCDAKGRLWVGTMGATPKPTEPELDKGNLFCLDNGLLMKAHGPVHLSNGLAWTQDNSIMYYIDSVPRLVYAFDFDFEKGSIANKRVVVDFNQWAVEDAGYPDGMCIDTSGKIWVAGYFSGKVMQFDPETGTRLRHVSIPGLKTTSCCFGGKNYSELFVTTSTRGAEGIPDPLAGSIFKVTDLGAMGLPAHNYAG